MTDLHSRITAALLREDQLRVCKLSDADIKFMADAVIRELTESIPPIVATAIQGFAQSELAAMSYHGGSKDAFEVMEKMNREALQIAKYATTHKDWKGTDE